MVANANIDQRKRNTKRCERRYEVPCHDGPISTIRAVYIYPTMLTAALQNRANRESTLKRPSTETLRYRLAYRYTAIALLRRSSGASTNKKWTLPSASTLPQNVTQIRFPCHRRQEAQMPLLPLASRRNEHKQTVASPAATSTKQSQAQSRPRCRAAGSPAS